MNRKLLAVLVAALALPMTMFCQVPVTDFIPKDVYYLMPSFGDGVVYLRGQFPAKGQLNICALDNTLRFIDEEGEEKTALDEDKIVRVVIESTWFIKDGDVYYRMYPVTSDIGVAQQRKLTILRGAKEGAYGEISQTGSIRNARSYSSRGSTYYLNNTTHYKVDTLIRIYHSDVVYPLNKKSLRTLFPGKKKEVDAWFKAGHRLPDNVPAATDLLKYLSQD